MAGLLEMLSDRANIDIGILKSGLAGAPPKVAAALNLEAGAQVVTLMRLVSYRRRPILLNKVYLVFDPRSPIVESELEASSLYGLFSGQGNSFMKKAILKLEPCLSSAAEAACLEMDAAAPVFKICYTFYDYSDSPVGTGWFMTPVSNAAFSTRIGVWDE
jgi:GntR family transcriptional regulator